MQYFPLGLCRVPRTALVYQVKDAIAPHFVRCHGKAYCAPVIRAVPNSCMSCEEEQGEEGEEEEAGPGGGEEEEIIN